MFAINNGQVADHATRVTLIERMIDGQAGCALLRQRVLHWISAVHGCVPMLLALGLDAFKEIVEILVAVA